MIAILDTYFPDSTHVCLVGLERADDAEIWAYASQNDFVIVTRDNDFSDMAALYGSPPKVIRLRISNCRWNEMQNHLYLLTELTLPDRAFVEVSTIDWDGYPISDSNTNV